MSYHEIGGNMSRFYLKSEKIFLENEIFSGYIEIKNGIIVNIFKEEKKLEDNIKVIDYSGKIIAPGFFDTHVHGFGGFDVMDATKEAIIEISRGIVKTGVTSFLPTTLTDTTEKLNSACENVNKYKDLCDGAKIQGIFLEGPFFTETYKGAQNPKFMSNPDIKILKKWKNLSGNLVNKIAIAPERENSIKFIKDATEEGVTISLAHSNATYEQAIDAVNHGAKIFVHTFNGMSPLHHRNPGMVGAALASDAYCELICDGHHLHEGAAKVVLKAKTTDKTVLITDCMRAGGMKDGNYTLGDFDVIVKDGTARLHSGSLAGSILKLCEAVKNLVDWNIATPFEAVKMASITPAKSVGLDKTIGSIAVGKCADINILNDDMTIDSVYIDGNKKI